MVPSRRLIADQLSLRRSPLPPNYLWEDFSASPDDLTQLTILVTGAKGTPYSQGLWRLHLKLPEDYPRSPPKATFKTRIFHPNVEELSGAVCLETLKRDWDPKLNLRDVLLTISCLLIQANPDSALNSSAAALLQEGYESFARQARLMTSIHAPIPKELREMVQEAKTRGEDPETRPHRAIENRPSSSTSLSRSSSSSMMKKAVNNSAAQLVPSPAPETGEDSDGEEAHDPFKENDPSLSPSPVTPPPPRNVRRSPLGKRPLSDLPTPTGLDSDESGMSASERNISANMPSSSSSKSSEDAQPPLRKSPKLTEISGQNTAGRSRDGPHDESKSMSAAEEEKENMQSSKGQAAAFLRLDLGQKNSPFVAGPSQRSSTVGSLVRQTSNTISGANGKSNKARVGIRRL